ncbi:MAG: low molecular weight phosphotyrosine protein phosphatase [Thioclava marina]|uniref:arsenate reductase/protein-tyrosine-phosphatase family protein n=1 Tax=Thioclava TaxID=285107 RepID=UPI0009982018|nr:MULTISPECIES: phosphotyrosine protein phosphatase [Thioclava]MBC7145927.1 low molecular weight phosphotyrosine protein phosphatase [Thioclava marina]OOY26792.1 phosphotyrosine protein phosphatase [Thioclava sp. L04-15]TNE93984.1 MAG: low molecular weight phosphotyrosine protein phosphatase [Paracoccaceae bacterium]
MAQVGSILVVCVGNICRSPVGERLLARELPEVTVSSAGIGAVVGAPADKVMREVAEAEGVSLEGHVARQFTAEIGAAHELILVMEAGHRSEITRIAPHLSGRTMLFDQWLGGQGIPDPYRKPIEIHRAAFAQIRAAADGWVTRLGRKRGQG